MKILISRQEPRSKYFENMKDSLQWFDICFDASSMLKDGSDGRPPAVSSEYFSDLMPGFRKLHSISDFFSAVEGNRIEHAVFFDPAYPNQKIELLVGFLESHGSAVHFLLTRHTVNQIRLRYLLRVAAHKPLGIMNQKALEIDSIIAPTVFSLAGWAGRLRAKRFVVTNHIWSFSVSDKVEVSDQVVFADSYFPFHTEMPAYGPHRNPEDFYGRLMAFIRLIAEDAPQGRVWFSKHPNSQGKEERHIAKPAVITTSLATSEGFHSVKSVWSFGSTSSAFALAAGKENRFLTFPDLLPKKTHEYIVRRGKALGIPVYQFDGKILRSVFRPMALSFLKRRITRVLFKALYARKSLSLVDALKTCEKN